MWPVESVGRRPRALRPGAPDGDSIVNDQRVRYPHVQVQLTGRDGNAYAVLGAVIRALRQKGVPKHLRIAFVAEATASDYDHLLATAMRWVDVS